MIPLIPPALDELPPFRTLKEVASKFGVQLLLYGGAATRAAMYLSCRPGFEFDLFDIAPFASDIDLVHSGDAKKTAEIKNLILDKVPFASWCRWTLLDWEKWQSVESNIFKAAELPLRRIVFTTGEPRPWPQEAIRDLTDRQVSIE